MRMIPNQEVPCSKPLGGSKVDSSLRLIKLAPGILENLVAKSKVPPRCGLILDAVEPLPQKEAMRSLLYYTVTTV